MPPICIKKNAFILYVTVDDVAFDVCAEEASRFFVVCCYYPDLRAREGASMNVLQALNAPKYLQPVLYYSSYCTAKHSNSFKNYFLCSDFISLFKVIFSINPAELQRGSWYILLDYNKVEQDTIGQSSDGVFQSVCSQGTMTSHGKTIHQAQLLTLQIQEHNIIQTGWTAYSVKQLPIVHLDHL